MITEDELEQECATSASVEIAFRTVGGVLTVIHGVLVLSLIYILAKLIIGIPWYYVPHPSDTDSRIQMDDEWTLEPVFPPELPQSERYKDYPVTEDPDVYCPYAQ